MEDFDDTPFDPEAVVAGCWLPGPYGSDDQRGSWNEVTPEKTAAALARLDAQRPVRSYDLSETLSNDFPSMPGRHYEQVLSTRGCPPPEGFEGTSLSTEPLGPYQICSLEERVSTTYNIGTKINGLHHGGIAGKVYNGFDVREIARSWGTTHLGNETQGPIVTRGVVLDVLGQKVAAGEEAHIEWLPHGRPMLREKYRIRVEDIEAALDFAAIRDPIGPGDAVLFRTGWRELIATDPDRYCTSLQAGPYLRECRYLASRRPALIASDSRVFGAAREDMAASMLPHQELAVRYGIRVGEGLRSDPLVEDGIFDFVFCWAPQNARGAVSGNSPPIALGQPRVGA